MKRNKLISIMNKCKGNILLDSILYNPIKAEFTHDDHVLNLDLVSSLIQNKVIKHTKIIDFQGVKYLRYILCN